MIPRDQNNNEFLQFCESYYWPKYKDPESIKWWSTRENDINSISNVKSSNKSPSFRYNFYNNVMHRYPKMHLPYDKFVRQLPRLQNYLALPKYWRDNKKKEKKEKSFLSIFRCKNGNHCLTKKHWTTEYMIVPLVIIRNF